MYLVYKSLNPAQFRHAVLVSASLWPGYALNPLTSLILEETDKELATACYECVHPAGKISCYWYRRKRFMVHTTVVTCTLTHVLCLAAVACTLITPGGVTPLYFLPCMRTLTFFLLGTESSCERCWISDGFLPSDNLPHICLVMLNEKKIELTF